MLKLILMTKNSGINSPSISQILPSSTKCLPSSHPFIYNCEM